jgi:hypothetical protein
LTNPSAADAQSRGFVTSDFLAGMGMPMLALGSLAYVIGLLALSIRMG